MPRPGLLISNRYLLDERVAGGGMGEVWRGTDPVLQRPVAVKVLLPALHADAEFISRFRAEAQMMAALRHPGIVQVYDCGASLVDDVQRDYLVMEYVDGTPLADRITAAGALPVDETLSVVAQAAEALQVAHDAGIVHRDVKPSNLMVRPDGSVVLLDFGVARSVDAGGVTKVNQVVGSPQYMAPEQVAGLPVTGATDVYALGAVAYTCLAGRAPFVGENPAQVIAQLLYGEPAPLPVDLPPTVAALVTRAMSKAPAHRFPTATALATAARAASAGDAPPGAGWAAPAPPAAPAASPVAAWGAPPAAAQHPAWGTPPTSAPPTSAPPASAPPASAPPAPGPPASGPPASGPPAAASSAPFFPAPPGVPPTPPSAARAGAGRPDAWIDKRPRSRKPLVAGLAALVIGIAAVAGALTLRPENSSPASPNGDAPVSAAAALDNGAAGDSSGRAAGQPTPTPPASNPPPTPSATTPATPSPASTSTAPASPTPAPSASKTPAPKPVTTEINKAVAKTGKRGAGPCSAKLVGGYGCYQTYGDVWWVFDTKADGHSAVVFWEVGGRKGQCANSMGNGKTGVCNKNYAEGLTGTAKVCIMDWDTKQMHGCTANFRFSTS
ncbi:serine/threonine-protein kinase [Cryptosporangium phraense]|uniref:non-specific serine/threonine protein kinase n=1 Tax=Cryptosporangium phraense TaxID=2593070 RepID=A0A545AWP8_9ACTN|nr:serine/threonine-protein kinase [Cryptosporangium phraense]TQS45759.1 serine/threonine protein kinase [Cryptosporangium phraense]